MLPKCPVSEPLIPLPTDRQTLSVFNVYNSSNRSFILEQQVEGEAVGPTAQRKSGMERSGRFIKGQVVKIEVMEI